MKCERWPVPTWFIPTLLTAAIVAPGLAQDYCVPEAATERAPLGSAPNPAALDARAQLEALRARAATAAGSGEPIVATSAPGAPRLAPEGDRRVQVGRVEALGTDVGFRDVRPGRIGATPLRLAHGTLQGTPGGGFQWDGTVSSQGAAALRLRFTGFYLPRNAALYLWSEEGDAFGPYTGRGLHGDGEFWSHTLRGSTVNLQLLYDGRDLANALRATRFVISDVGHLTSAFPFGRPQPEAGSNLCQENAPCVENAECINIPPAITPAQDAVAAYTFVSGAFMYLCSGGLINDTDAGSTIPLFLTANHCLSRARDARSVNAYFDYRSQDCALDSCAVTTSPTQVTPAELVATNRTGDFTLLRLGSMPSGGVLLGWRADAVAGVDGEALFRISHPQGSPQAYSTHVVDTDRPTCSSWPRGSWIYSSDLVGGTEPGSSGSPVLDRNGRIVGQLSGACGYNVSDSCDKVQNATVDGAFASYFGQISSILDPVTACTDADGDGYCAETNDCDDADGAINPGAAENCSDGVDNDCDGLIDGNDPQCQTGSCDNGAVGDRCDRDEQCCSNKCRGREGARFCR